MGSAHFSRPSFCSQDVRPGQVQALPRGERGRLPCDGLCQSHQLHRHGHLPPAGASPVGQGLRTGNWLPKVPECVMICHDHFPCWLYWRFPELDHGKMCPLSQRFNLRLLVLIRNSEWGKIHKNYFHSHPILPIPIPILPHSPPFSPHSPPFPFPFAPASWSFSNEVLRTRSARSKPRSRNSLRWGPMLGGCTSHAWQQRRLAVALF